MPYINGLKRLTCNNCPSLAYIPNIYYSTYTEELLKLPYIGSKYLVNNNSLRLYNNIYSLWKHYKLKKYILYLEKEYYSNPQMPYMKYYISNELYDKDESKLKIGYINSKKELIWYRLD